MLLRNCLNKKVGLSLNVVPILFSLFYPKVVYLYINHTYLSSLCILDGLGIIGDTVLTLENPFLLVLKTDFIHPPHRLCIMSYQFTQLAEFSGADYRF